MTHPDGDTILKFALQLLDGPENLIVRDHLSGCTSCRGLYEKARNDMARLENIGFDISVPEPPRLIRRSRAMPDVWRWAAVLAAGFLLGYITANLTEPLPPIPVQQHLIPESDRSDSSGFASCPAVDVNASSGGIR